MLKAGDSRGGWGCSARRPALYGLLLAPTTPRGPSAVPAAARTSALAEGVV